MKAGKSMQEVSESGELKTFIDRRLIKAIGHPVREHLLAVFNERIASAREIGDEIGADVSSFYHHIEELERLECIERVATKQRRGAKEHFFQAKSTFVFDDEAWQRLPASLRADMSASFVQAIFDDVVAALREETFNARDNRHASWTPGFVDIQGWDETMDLMSRTLDELVAIRKAAALRLAKAEKRGIPATIGIVAFETPGGAGDEAPSGPSHRPEQTPRQA